MAAVGAGAGEGVGAGCARKGAMPATSQQKQSAINKQIRIFPPARIRFPTVMMLSKIRRF